MTHNLSIVLVAGAAVATVFTVSLAVFSGSDRAKAIAANVTAGLLWVYVAVNAATGVCQ